MQSVTQVAAAATTKPAGGPAANAGGRQLVGGTNTAGSIVEVTSIQPKTVVGQRTLSNILPSSAGPGGMNRPASSVSTQTGGTAAAPTQMNVAQVQTQKIQVLQ